jgi:hypothetical protein
LNVHYHLVVPDGVFVADEDTGELSVLRLPGPDLLAILDRVADRIAGRLADEAGDRDDVDTPSDLWSQLQTEAATTWRSPPRPSSIARGTDLGRAWDDRSAGGVLADDRGVSRRALGQCSPSASAHLPAIDRTPRTDPCIAYSSQLV